MLNDDVKAFVTNFATYDYSQLNGADSIRMVAEVLALFDPTGASSIIAAYSYDKCSNYMV